MEGADRTQEIYPGLKIHEPRIIRLFEVLLHGGPQIGGWTARLPLLEYALEQAWAKRAGPRIGLPQYAGLEQALEERANALYRKLSGDDIFGFKSGRARRRFMSKNSGAGSKL